MADARKIIRAGSRRRFPKWNIIRFGIARGEEPSRFNQERYRTKAESIKRQHSSNATPTRWSRLVFTIRKQFADFKTTNRYEALLKLSLQNLNRQTRF